MLCRCSNTWHIYTVHEPHPLAKFCTLDAIEIHGTATNLLCYSISSLLDKHDPYSPYHSILTCHNLCIVVCPTQEIYPLFHLGHTLLPTAMVCPLGLQQMLMFSPLVFTVWAALPTTVAGEAGEDHMIPQSISWGRFSDILYTLMTGTFLSSQIVEWNCWYTLDTEKRWDRFDLLCMHMQLKNKITRKMRTLWGARVSKQWHWTVTI